jgi:hypothetical protein
MESLAENNRLAVITGTTAKKIQGFLPVEVNLEPFALERRRI